MSPRAVFAAVGHARRMYVAAQTAKNFKILKRPAWRFKLERAKALKFHGGLGAARSDLRASAAIAFERKP